MLTNIAANAFTNSDFYFYKHKAIFSPLKDAYLQDKPAGIHLIAKELKRRDKLENVGGVTFLTTLAQYAGPAAYIEEYTELMHNKALHRKRNKYQFIFFFAFSRKKPRL